jgi:hypothetical protein
MDSFDLQGLTRATTDNRDRVRRRVLALSTAAGVVALGATGALTIALVPSNATAASPTSTAVSTTAAAKTAAANAAAAAQAQAQAQARQQAAQAPVATSGGS